VCAFKGASLTAFNFVPFRVLTGSAELLLGKNTMMRKAIRGQKNPAS